jgi:hypothetical protein
MAFTSWITNQIPASGGEALYNLKEMLKGAGWTVNGYSDGTTYLNNSAGVDGITTGGSGAGGFNNSAAWIRLTSPAGNELIFQRGSSNEAYVHIRQSPSSGFGTGGDATNAPTASDQVDLFYSNSTGGQLFDTGGTYYMQGGADNSNGYGFWIACYGFSQNIRVGFVMEPLLQTDSNDTDPGKQNLFYLAATGSNAYAIDTISNINVHCASFLGGTWTTVPGNYYRTINQTMAPGAVPSNPYSSTDDRFPIIYAKPPGGSPTSYPYGYKGQGRLMMWEGITRSCADTKESKTRIAFGNISLPWDGTTTPSV